MATRYQALEMPDGHEPGSGFDIAACYLASHDASSAPT